MRRPAEGTGRPGRDEDGRAKLYADIAHPINSACREMIQQRVIQAFEEERARSKLPGYVPSYDDFEPPDVGPPPRPASVVAAQFQPAEKPRGPHKPPAPSQVNGAAESTFGAGIFE